MLYVKTKVLPSKIHGLGLFADEFIPKGTVVWRFMPGFDQRFTREQILAFPELLQTYLYTYVWKNKKSGFYIFCADGGKYFNYSKDSNCFSDYRDNEEEVVTTAIKDIQIGKELTDNYYPYAYEAIEGNVLDEIAEKYNIGNDFEINFQEKYKKENQNSR